MKYPSDDVLKKTDQPTKWKLSQTENGTTQAQMFYYTQLQLLQKSISMTYTEKIRKA